MSDRRPTTDDRRPTTDDRRPTTDDQRGAHDYQPSSSVLRPRSAIELHIDELVLHGFAASDRHAIGVAVERELARLIGEQGLPPAIGRSGERWRLDGGAFNLAAGAPAEVIGTQVARVVYAGLIR
jgi:hypothetical protein